jgi:general secretion pathway protein J
MNGLRSRPAGKVVPGGFTLIEVLVAVAVFGLIAGGLIQAVRYGMQAWQSQVRMGEGPADLDAVDRSLRHMLEVIDPGDGVEPAPITGRHDHLEFISVLPNAGGAGPARRIAATLTVDSAHRLVLLWRPYFHAAPLRPAPAPTVTELLRGVSRLQVSFWQPGGGWTSEWRNPELPALIRLKVMFPEGDRRHWPDIVVAPLLDQP